MNNLDPSIVEFVRQLAGSDRYATYLRGTLLELCAINTAPEADLAATAARERTFFDWLQREIGELLGQEATMERVPIAPAVATDPAYTPPRYAVDGQGSALPAERVYADRGNLVAVIRGAEGDGRRPVILHAHVDVVPPWIPPQSAGDRVIGRGACDNKAQIAVLLAQMKLLKEIEEKAGRRPGRGRVYQFAIDEEIGGNGSLSLVSDSRFAGCPVLMHETTDLIPYCAHRGAVWYRCRLSTAGIPGRGAVELFPHVVMALEAEGQQLREETKHPLFGPEHVQTNHGILGPYGGSPGAVCDHVAVEVVALTKADPQRVVMKMTEFLDEALSGYVRLYGDKARELDPTTGRPKVEKHFAVQYVPAPDRQIFRVDVWGRSGHMGALSECDNAITKAAFLLRVLVKAAANFPNVQATARLADGPADQPEVTLEGGQGFSPCHPMADVQARMVAAARRGAEKYCKIRGCPFDERMVEMTFDRLHNDAYAADPGIEPMQALLAASAAVGEPKVKPIGWKTSCDARLYHARGCPVAIFGAGKLEAAHSDHEYVDVPDMQKALAISTLATWALIQ
jgi:acetylornithine deacetylase/succinyl-diaminopimelate desuccinylase-like protein